jgi:peroxiredoxin Q/BCP
MEAYRDQYASLFRGGRDVVLLAVSTDTAEDQYEWARDAEFPFLFGSDPGAEIGRTFGAYIDRGAGRYTDNRTLFVIDPQGRIAWRAAPFREVDPTAYEELGRAIERIVQQDTPAAGEIDASR